MAQQFDSGNDAVLAERKPPHAMVASRTKSPHTLIALNHRGILGMVATVHHPGFPLPFIDSCARSFPVCRRRCPCVDRRSVFAGEVVAVFVRECRLRLETSREGSA